MILLRYLSVVGLSLLLLACATPEPAPTNEEVVEPKVLAGASQSRLSTECPPNDHLVGTAHARVWQSPCCSVFRRSETSLLPIPKGSPPILAA